MLSRLINKQTQVVLNPPVCAGVSVVFIVLSPWLFGDWTLLARPYRLIGLLLVAAGLALVGRVFLMFRRHQTTVQFKASKTLVTKGPFRFSRNPMYLGSMLVQIGLAVCTGNAVSILGPVVFFGFLNFIFVPFEEEKMVRDIGQEYLDYKHTVRRWI